MESCIPVISSQVTDSLRLYRIAVTTVINELIAPVRAHFQNNAEAKKLLETIRKFKITK
jgi:hypothetical protein